jgi:hypothetical protein
MSDQICTRCGAVYREHLLKIPLKGDWTKICLNCIADKNDILIIVETLTHIQKEIRLLKTHFNTSKTIYMELDLLETTVLDLIHKYNT